MDLHHTNIAASGNDGQVWQVTVDGSSSEQGARARVVLESPDGEETLMSLDWNSRPQTIRLNMRL